MASREHKVVVIGAKGYDCANDGTRVTCFDWDELSRLKNIRDFDTVLINLLELDKERVENGIDWELFFDLLTVSNAVDVLLHDGKFIILGDPRFEAVRNFHHVPFLHWTGLDLKWDGDPGDTILYEYAASNKTYAEYVKYLKHWEYSLAHCEVNTSQLGTRFNIESLRKKSGHFAISCEPICRNRYKHPIMFCINLQLLKKLEVGAKLIQAFGPIIFLPKISLPPDETLQIVLRDICEVAVNLPEPEWLAKYSAPGQLEIDEHIKNLETEVDVIKSKLQAANSKRMSLRDCLKLLYERELALEPAVRSVLTTLGAEVERPKENNKEDGWIKIKIAGKTYEGVLEIKSTRSDHFGEEGRKQLLDWMDRGRTIHKKQYKGIFIGNSAVNKPLKERPDAFGPNWVSNAKLSEICAIKTEDLYIIYLLHTRRQIDLDVFWKELFETNGVFEMKRYREVLRSQGKGK